MGKQLTAAVLLVAALSLAPMPAPAGPAKDLKRELLVCTARGDALVEWYYADFYSEIVATGTCIGSSAGPLSVSVTGSGVDYFDGSVSALNDGRA